jgi:two-component system, OmpR family, response regulator
MNNPIPAANPGGTPRKTILVVDDDDAVRRGLRWILVTEGYQVVDARHGREAIQIFQLHPCDLALLDMNMPLLNGWGTIAVLRSLNSRLPAIIITARPDQRNVAREAGVELLEKPVNLPLLLKRVRALLSKPQDDVPADMAEGVGFEPTVSLTPRSISSRVP